MIKITNDEIILDDYLNLKINPNSGSLLYFLGTTRNNNLGKKVKYLEYETFEEMAISKLDEISKYAVSEWQLNQLDIIHRIGRVNIAETSLLIIVSSPHRKESFLAIEYIVDELKKIVPIWKKEFYLDGSAWIGTSDNPN
tara:strand:+ start:801 stop:1220 length:420 start_codon:yes stop_codon:yes gene_type:complete